MDMLTYGESDATPVVPARRLALEMTLRQVGPLDELVLFVEQCTARLEEEWPGTGRCTIIVTPLWTGDRTRYFEVVLRVVGPRDYAEVRHIDRDLFLAVEEAFESITLTLTDQGSPVSEEPQELVR